MTFLQILAVTLQLADGVHTCHTLRDARFAEYSPILGRHPSCTQVLALKGASLAPIFTVPSKRWRVHLAWANIGWGGVGLSVSVYTRRKVGE